MSASKPRLHMLDALRGVCAIAIMVYHYLSWNGMDFHQVGSFGVYIFFILSGFSMWYVYADTEISGQSVRAFFVSRFARIFPLYLLVNARYLLDATNPTVAKTFILNVAFLFGFASPGLTSGITGGWSIGIEWVFYVAFPLLWACLYGLRTMLVMLAFSIIVNQIYVASLFPQASFTDLWVDYAQFPVFMVYFFAGIVCADLFKKFYTHKPEGLSVPKQWLARFGIVVCMLVIFAFPSEGNKDFLLGWHFPLLILLASLAVFLCALVRDISPLGIKLCKFLGDISFSTYMTHYLVYAQGTRFFGRHYPEVNTIQLLPLFGCATLVVAYVLFRFYEMPARKLINRKFKGHRVH